MDNETSGPDDVVVWIEQLTNILPVKEWREGMGLP